MTAPLKIWHHGLVARWWAESNEGGEDVAYFREAIERSGEPVLDAGCGTGRLLLPFVREGMDVDGSERDLRIRLSGFDPETRIATREIRVRQFVEDREVASEGYAIDLCVYSIRSIESLLGTAGFSEVRITGGLEDRARQQEDERIVFHATVPTS